MDHLQNTCEDGARLLARSASPRSSSPPAGRSWTSPSPARKLVDEGAIVALATDFNPGSSFCESLPLVTNLGCTRLGLSPAEALSACTANAVHVLG